MSAKRAFRVDGVDVSCALVRVLCCATGARACLLSDARP